MITNGKIWICALFLAGFWACSDDSENVTEEVTAQDIANASIIDEASVPFMDAVSTANGILSDEGLIVGRIQKCYTASTTQMDNQLLVTFESTCTGEDGKVRSGSMLIEWTKTQEILTSYTVVFDGYEEDGYGLSGMVSVSNISFKENGYGQNVLVTDGMITCPDGKQILYEQDFDYNLTIGEVLEIRITGSATGSGKEGNSYTANIKEPILVVSGCDHAVSGSFDASFNNRPPVNINYGDGSCDNKAVASRGDHSVSFDLD